MCDLKQQLSFCFQIQTRNKIPSPLEFSKKNVSVFWGAIQQSKKKLHTQKKQGSQLKQQILKNFRFSSLQFVCYTKTFFSQTKNSLSFLFFRKRDDFTWMHQTAPKETVEGLWERPKNSGMWVPPQNSWCFSWQHWLWGTPLDTSALLNPPPPSKQWVEFSLGFHLNMF